MLDSLLWRYRFARGLEPYLNSIDQHAKELGATAKAHLALRMLEQIHYFGNRADALPEWRHAARVKDPLDIWRIWHELPIITKLDLRERFFPARMQRDCGVVGESSATGGSTGEPTPYLHDPEMLRVVSASVLYTRLAMGWRPGMPTICIWGSERDVGKVRGWRAQMRWSLRRQHLVDGYRLDERTVDRVLDIVKRHRPVAIFGFTSMLEFVARSVIERGAQPPAGDVRLAWNGGEMLFENQRAQFQQAFGVPILNLYGGRELSAMAFEPSHGASFRILRPFVFLEIVDEKGKPASPGEPGRVIATSLVCRGTPFIRYDIGDLASYAERDWDESGIRALDRIYGRRSSVVLLPDGRHLHCLFWNHLLKDYPEVHQFQVVLRKPASLTLRLKGQQLSGQRQADLLAVVQRALGGLPFDVEWREQLPLTAQGKLLQVLQE